MFSNVGISRGNTATTPPVWTTPAPPRPPMSIMAPTTLPPATEGVSYSHTFAATGATRYVVANPRQTAPAGSQVFVVESPDIALPSGEVFPIGLSFNQTTGVMSGRPMTPAVFGGAAVPVITTFWIGAAREDATGRVVAIQIRPFVLRTTPDPAFDRTRPTWISAASPTPLGTYTHGTPMSLSLQASDPSGALTYRFVSPWAASGVVNTGAQPATGTIGGLTISSSGVISGTPSVSHGVTAIVNVRVQNGRGLFRDQNIAIRVNRLRQAPVWLTPAGTLSTSRRGSGFRFANYIAPGTTLTRGTNQLEAEPDVRNRSHRYRIVSGSLPLGMITIPRAFPAQGNWPARNVLELSGIPSARNAAGTYTFTVRCEYIENPEQDFSERTFSLILT